LTWDALRLLQISSRSRRSLETQALLREALAVPALGSRWRANFDGPFVVEQTTSQGERRWLIGGTFAAQSTHAGSLITGVASSTPDRGRGAGKAVALFGVRACQRSRRTSAAVQD